MRDAPHVLLVEDSALVVGALRILLEASGHRVSSAGTVKEAIATAELDPPNVMLLDLTLPDGDGLDVLSSLAGRGHAPPVTVAVTGHDEASVRERCLTAGCTQVLTKPIAAMKLPGLIDEWLSAYRVRTSE